MLGDPIALLINDGDVIFSPECPKVELKLISSLADGRLDLNVGLENIVVDVQVGISCSIVNTAVTIGNSSLWAPMGLVTESPLDDTTNSIETEMKTSLEKKTFPCKI